MFMPPGVIKTRQTKINQVSKLPNKIKNATPSDTIYLRKTQDFRSDGAHGLAK